MSALEVALVLLGLIALSTVIGLFWRAGQGRIMHSRSLTVVKPGELPGVRRFASGATLLQFSTEVCAPCRTAHRVLEQTAAEFRNVTHVDVDLTNRPDIAKRFNILQTPTTLILDAKGAVKARVGGAPRPASVRAELERILAV